MTYTKLSLILFGIALSVFIIMLICDASKESIGYNMSYGIFVFGSILEVPLLLAGIIISLIACFKEKHVLSWIGLSLFLMPVIIILLNMIDFDNILHKPATSVRKQLSTISEQINISAPVMVNEELRLDGSFSLSHSKYIIYYYTFVNRSKDEVNNEELEEIMYNDMKDNPYSKFFRTNGIEVHYLFKDKNNNWIDNLSYDFSKER